jgi:hypothetical protein
MEVISLKSINQMIFRNVEALCFVSARTEFLILLRRASASKGQAVDETYLYKP